MNRYRKAFDLLRAAFGEQGWWPADTPWEVCTGAVLTQNTNWNNVEKALALIKQRDVLDPRKTLDLPMDELSELIRPSGVFRIKAARLKSVAEWWLNHRESTAETVVLRKSLLAVKGVGPETADAILLYALKRPVFMIDAYTKRIAARHLGTAADITYHELQEKFTANLDPDLRVFGEYHALLIRAAQHYCRKSECLPGCPLRKIQ